MTNMLFKVAATITLIALIAVFLSEPLIQRISLNCEHLATIHALVGSSSSHVRRCPAVQVRSKAEETTIRLLQTLREEAQGIDHCQESGYLSNLSDPQGRADRQFLLAGLLNRCGYDELAVKLWQDVGADIYFGTLGQMRAKEGDLAGAEQAYSYAIQISPSKADWLLNRASVRLEGEDYAGALRDAEAAIELDPDLEPAYLIAGRSARRAGEIDTAESWFLHAYDRFPDSPTPSVYLGSLYSVFVKDYAKAEQYILHGLAIDADHVTLNYQAAWLNYARGDLEQAIAYMERATSKWRVVPIDRLVPEQRNTFALYAATLAEWYAAVGEGELAHREACLVLSLSPPPDARGRAQSILLESEGECSGE